jgi:2-(1,2-epoxy-1,2-dihydrophenyl)acetyl-CoA isomerase
MTTTYEHIILDVEGPIARLTMNRPERMNAMTNRMVQETTQALEDVATRSDVRILVLTGAGRAFCPGADLQGVTTGSGADVALTVDDFRAPVLLREMPAVTVALVNGACAGAGFGWACACDLRLATRSAKFNSAFLDVGVAGDMAGPWTLARLVGAAKARELYFIPDKFSADEAQRIGLVARVFDDDVFAEQAASVVERLAAASPAGLRTMKANFTDSETMSLAEFSKVESQRHMDLFKNPDTREAFAAKVEKRAPRWTS